MRRQNFCIWLLLLFLVLDSTAAHRALPDVEAMESLFMSTPLHDILASLGVRSPQQQIELWTLRKQKWQAVPQQLVRFFGKKIAKPHASQLTEKSITVEILEQWKLEARRSFRITCVSFSLGKTDILPE